MNVLSHEQTRNTTAIVLISFIDMGQEEKKTDSNTHTHRKKHTGSVQSLSFVLLLTLFIYAKRITPTFLKI
jgi:hypothetical protein